MNKVINIIVTGDTVYDNYAEQATFCDKIVSDYDNVNVITGNKEGTETNAQVYAANRGFQLTLIDEEGDKFYDRHRELLNRNGGDTLVAFWGGQDHETKAIIDKAYWYGKRIKVLGYI